MVRTVKLSFEFFPPKTETGMEQLQQTAQALQVFKPDFYSVTFGAGGNTREGTIQAVQSLMSCTSTKVAPHLSCIGSTRQTISSMLKSYQQLGLQHLVALRGDIPISTSVESELRYATQLIELIRQETANHFHIEVAAYPEFHPESQNAEQDILNLKRKYEAGANSAITQFFFNADAYFHYVEACNKHGVHFPIVPGLMPILKFDRLVSFASSCGAEIPLWIRKRVEAFGDDQHSIKQFGIELLVNLCEQLLAGGAPGFHFYTLNRAELSTQILNALPTKVLT